MKGVSPLISHSLFIAIGAIFLIMILTTVTTVKENITETSVSIQLTTVADAVAEQLLDLYHVYEDSSTAEGKVKLDIPGKIGDRKYKIYLDDGIIVRGLAENTEVKTKRNFTLPIEFSGEAYAPGYLTLTNGAIELIE